MKKLLPALILTLSMPAAMAELLRAGTASNWPPYTMDTVQGPAGITIDIFRAILQRSGDTASIGLFPPPKLDALLNDGMLDVNIADAPAWNMLPEDEYVFSDSYLDIHEYLYSLNVNAVNAEAPEDFTDKTLAMIEGYHYRAFNPFFEDGQIAVLKVPHNYGLLQALNQQDADAAFFDSRLFDYLLACSGDSEDNYYRGMALKPEGLRLKIHRSKAELLPRLNAAIAALKQDGTIDEIVTRHTHAGADLVCQPAFQALPFSISR